MLAAFRSSKSNVFVWIIILLLIVGLAGFGISQSGGGSARLAVASVGDEDVTVDEFGTAYQNEMRQLSQNFGRQISQQEMQLFGGEQRVLSRLLSLAALDNETKRLELSVGDETVRERLVQNRAFFGLTGGFDPETYQQILERSGINPAEYENEIRDDAARQILSATIVGGVQYGQSVPTEIVKFIAERRGVSFIKLTEDTLTNTVASPTDSDLGAYYEANKETYRRPELREVSYVALRESDLLDSVDVDEAEIRDEYESRRDEFSQDAMVSLDRIVFGTSDEAQAASDSIIAGDTDFDAIATERGLTPADIEQGEVTAAALSAQERDPIFAATGPGVVGPVQSSLGPALYRINAIIPASSQSYEEARTGLRAEIAFEIAAEELADTASEVEDLLAGGATLEEIAQTTPMLLNTLTFDPNVTEGVSGDPGFRREVLEADVNEDRDLQDLADEGVFALRVTDIKAPAIPPLADIKDAVSADWSKAKTLEALTFRAEDLEKRIKAGETLETIATELALTVQTPDAVQRNQAIEGAPATLTEALFDGINGDPVITDDGDAAYLAVIGDLIPANMNDQSNRDALLRITQTLQAGVSEDLLNYFAIGLQERDGVSVNQGLIQSVLSQVHQY